MSDTDSAQIYLATPKSFALAEFSNSLAEVLDTFSVACVRLSVATEDEVEISKIADQLREICHARDVAIVIDDHYRIVTKLGLDGVHLTDGAKHVRDARKELGDDAIVGTFCGTSRHVGMSAAEIGTDYISFGPLSDDGALGDGAVATDDLFKWWSEMIEVPVVAEGEFKNGALEAVKDHIDFMTLGGRIWQSTRDPVAEIRDILDIIQS